MRKINVLDCTLRDGGYVNECHFGRENIKKIVRNLNEANIDIIECGFLKMEDSPKGDDYSSYSDLSELSFLEDEIDANKRYALMMLCETCDADKLPVCKENKFNLIRLAFHKRDAKKAITDAKKILDKGYELFLQPTATMGYSDDEILELINICNEIGPDAVAIVDTFGEMLGSDIIRYSKLFDKYLDSNITLAFHSHNNIQTAYSNALLFIDNTSADRDIVIDSSILGMGRGAGNLCSELIIDYLNKKHNKNYTIYPLLEIADNILEPIRQEKYWGYSLAYYLSGINHCHPKYCIYFSDKKTLTTKDLCLLMETISEDKKIDFDLEYADELYYSYLSRNISSNECYDRLKTIIGNKNVLLLGPGKTIKDNLDNIIELSSQKNIYFTISVNSIFPFVVDAAFISNRKRYKDIDPDLNCCYLLTSNIDDCNNLQNKIVFDYGDVLAKELQITDNALLLILNILKKAGISNVTLAGFDGYSHKQSQNYYDNKLLYLIDKTKVYELNKMLTDYISLYSNDLKLSFITETRYCKENTKCLIKEKKI